MQANAAGQFVIGGGQAVSFYSTNGQRLWQHAGTTEEWAAGEVICY